MAIRLNLYHEVAKQRRARRRDPVKLGLLGLIVVATLFVAFYFYRLDTVHKIKAELARVQMEWDRVSPKQVEAKTREAELTTNIKTADLLVKRIEGRFYWAPVMEQLTQTVPREVQFTRMDAELGDKVKPHAITLNGISSGQEPRKTAEDLRTAVLNRFSTKFKDVTSSFKSLENSEELVQLDSNSLETAKFAIQFQMYTPEAAATPAPEKRVREPKKIK